MKNKVSVISWILLAATTTLFIYVRLRLLTMPLERDEGEYAYAGQQILHGGVPYRDIYNMKFPGIYFFYSLLLLLFGNTVMAIRLGSLLINLITALFILKTGEVLKNRTTGIFAAGGFLALSIAPHFQGLMANAENFVNLFIAIGAFFIFSWIKRDKNFLFLCAGIMTAIACLMKQHGIYFLGVAIIAVLIHIPLQKKNLLKISQCIFILLGGFSIPFIVLLCWLTATGTYSKFVFFTIKYGKSYISYNSFPRGVYQFFFSFANCINNNHLIWLIVFTGLIFSNRLLPKKSFVLLLSWFVFAIAGVFPGYYFRDHYFLYMVLPSAIYFGLVFDYLLQLKVDTYGFLSRILTIMLFTGSMLYLIIGERRIFFIDTSQMAVSRIYRDQQFNEAVTVADTIKKYLPANQKLLVIGSEPEIYFYTHSTAASSYIYVFPMMENQPWRDSMNNEFIHQSIRNKPAVVIISRRGSISNSSADVILNDVKMNDTGLTLKGFCYKIDNKTDSFVWNKDYDKNIIPDSIIWKIYIKRSISLR